MDRCKYYEDKACPALKKEMRIVNWTEYLSIINSLAGDIKPYACHIDYICGIERGGLIPAIILSHELNKPYIAEGVCNIFRMLKKQLLIVDDIADTGKTLKKIITDTDIVATLHYKEHSIVKPRFYVQRIPNNIYIKYPYEKINEIKKFLGEKK
jgi:hypothetical protein